MDTDRGLFRAMVPETRNTTMRGPLLAQAWRRLPGPESFRFVTVITLPPLPPRVSAPCPSAPGKAGTPTGAGATASAFFSMGGVAGLVSVAVAMELKASISPRGSRVAKIGAVCFIIFAF